MERTKVKSEQLIIAFLIIIYTVGVLGHSFELTLPLMLILTPLTLAITGSVVYYGIRRKFTGKLFQWMGLTYLLTFTLEVAGVKTGLIFGEYYYGSSLGLKVFGTPLIIGINWVFVVLGAYNLAERSFKNDYLIIFSGAMLAVMFDFVMEPMAMKLDYWQWADNIIPLQNYIAWYIFAVFLLFFARRFDVRVHTLLPGIYFVIQFVFFFLLNITV